MFHKHMSSLSENPIDPTVFKISVFPAWLATSVTNASYTANIKTQHSICLKAGYCM